MNCPHCDYDITQVLAEARVAQAKAAIAARWAGKSEEERRTGSKMTAARRGLAAEKGWARRRAKQAGE